MNHLFIVGHPRARSTALAAVLGSHPAIAGYSEQQRHYDRYAHLVALRQQAARQYRPPKFGATWFLDKIVFNYRIGAEILSRQDVCILFIARPPDTAIPSMLRFTPRFRRLFQTAADCARLYQHRLRAIQTMASVIPPARAMFIHGDRLAEDPSSNLRAIERFLKLSTPLENRYRLDVPTETRIVGDPSVIRHRAGAIVATSRAAIHAYIDDESRRLFEEIQSVFQNTQLPN